MALYKKEVLVRPNSQLDFDGAMNWTRDWLNNTFQEKPENKNSDGSYKDYFFADVFFAYGHATNSGQTWRIYSDACKDRYNLQPAQSGRIEFLMIDKEGVDKKIGELDQRVEALENADNEVIAQVV